ncbi:uncharacterized protein ALTATR162_LOCUS95 [Alternaria atra]|uniref:Uncharacterized protein n=1 Tax=Alternaria atra TaxID=119953 RepID=A0A8J2HQU9_9PLEO|nr:uncharacterized protein ALTATR162_LOCUS95 [Alternaria atra]CAG5137413.1 unnamed protein product [Alternaria atra]
MNISETSSYLDLAPLYGSSLADQLEIRTMKEGKLKPDTFHEKRLFHNYVAEILLKINENGRFTLTQFKNPTPEDIVRAVAKQDHDLFNTARLIVGGLYINICLHDYLRAITNTHHSDSSWTLDPRVDIDKHFDPEGAPRGIGNQVSVEFNLLYCFHSCISKRDEKWTNDFFQSALPGKTVEDINKLDMYELLGGGLQKFFGNMNPDPSKREFGGLHRQDNGKFKDEDLVRVTKDSMEDPAGCFGAPNFVLQLRWHPRLRQNHPGNSPLHAPQRPPRPSLPAVAISNPLAASLSLDGFHLTRAQLSSLPDPATAHARHLLEAGETAARTHPPRNPDLHAPSFNHAVKDPVEHDIAITASVRIVVLEGNYLALDREPWHEAAGLMRMLRGRGW